MNFKRIEAFFWVAKLHSFSKAAAQQCTTQPAISTRIAALEEELDVKLLTLIHILRCLRSPLCRSWSLRFLPNNKHATQHTLT